MRKEGYQTGLPILQLTHLPVTELKHQAEEMCSIGIIMIGSLIMKEEESNGLLTLPITMQTGRGLQRITGGLNAARKEERWNPGSLQTIHSRKEETYLTVLQNPASNNNLRKDNSLSQGWNKAGRLRDALPRKTGAVVIMAAGMYLTGEIINCK